MAIVDSNRFNTIVVVDSVPTGESQTARRLREDLDVYSIAHAPSPKIEYTRVESADEFLRFLGNCRIRALSADLRPLIHIECHGHEDGFQMADGSLVDWPELKQPLIDLNTATELNLMITVAACTGGALAKVVSPIDRAPLWGLIGPTRTLTAGEIEATYSAFYRELMRTKRARDAIQALNATAGQYTFWTTSALDLFQRAWNGYRENFRSPQERQARIQRLQDELRQRGAVVPTAEQMEDIVARQEPISFQRFVRTFFMHDLFQANEQRFPLRYEDMVNDEL